MSPRRTHGNTKRGNRRYDRLAAAVRRLSANVRQQGAARGGPDLPQPHTGWEQQTESRLRAIEQQLANQNRLLLIAIVTVAGDIIFGLAR
jgi:hypothetical protein